MNCWRIFMHFRFLQHEQIHLVCLKTPKYAHVIIQEHLHGNGSNTQVFSFY